MTLVLLRRASFGPSERLSTYSALRVATTWVAATTHLLSLDDESKFTEDRLPDN